MTSSVESGNGANGWECCGNFRNSRKISQQQSLGLVRCCIARVERTTREATRNASTSAGSGDESSEPPYDRNVGQRVREIGTQDDCQVVGPPRLLEGRGGLDSHGDNLVLGRANDAIAMRTGDLVQKSRDSVERREKLTSSHRPNQSDGEGR